MQTFELTGHEVREVDSVVSFIGVVICKKLVVDEQPAERIWNYDDDAFDSSSVCGLAHIGF